MSRLSHVKRLLIATFVALFAVVPSVTTVVSAAPPTSEYDSSFQVASERYGVPVSLLKAISYSQSRWSVNQGQASISGGYGLMNLTEDAPIIDDETAARGDPSKPAQSETLTLTHYTLNEAAQLLGLPAASLKADQAQNIMGGAAVLAKYAKDNNNGTLPTDINGWQPAVRAFSGSTDPATAQTYTDGVYEVLSSGVQSTDDTGKQITITADPNARTGAKPSQNQNDVECPATLTCKFVAAGYGQNSDDKTDYGNYDPANRPKDMNIKYIIIHDTEGSYASAISHFQDTTSYTSTNYIIRSSDGEVTQMLKNSDVPFGAGNFYVNMHSINIEHEGYAVDGAKWYTPQMYRASATLVRWLAAKYSIPLDRNHILGHDNVPGTNTATAKTQHWDPGPYWDWNSYMELVAGRTTLSNRMPEVSNVIIMAPNFATNKQALQDCYTTPGKCQTLPSQGTSTVYLRTAPRDNAPYVNDKVISPNGTAGTNEISDWSATASAGQQFVVADKQGEWLAVWFNGVKGWFKNPARNQVAYVSNARTITPKTNNVAVYGRPVPKASVYPPEVKYPVESPLPYTLQTNQKYVALDGLTNDYFYDLTVDSSEPYDHDIFIGNTKYYQIAFNHRIAYVKASDVTLQ